MRSSNLNGRIEVAGQKAMIVIANPWGINCSGCGYINTNIGMLITGLPQFNENKGLLNYYVGNSVGGKIVIQKNGLIGTGADNLTLMTRSLESQGNIIGKNITLILGTNIVDSQAKIVPVIKPNPPAFALDVGYLGGMYAEQISLFSTEKGLGVKYNGELNKPDAKMEIDSQGNLGPKVTVNVNGDFSFS